MVMLEAEYLDEISIHAPRAGCDGSSQLLGIGLGDFNPRTPCGVRLPAL